jgi:hypothetical protein
VGKPQTSGKQHQKQRIHPDTFGNHDISSGIKTVQDQTDHHVQKKGNGVVGHGHDKAHVFDVINAGPLHRFTVRGRTGEVFIAHNCLQFSNGAMYPIAGMPLWEPVHDMKLDALEDIIDEAQGSPIISS